LRKYIIIGSGAAGIAAAETIRGHDPNASIQIFTNDPYGYYSRPGLAYYLCGELPEEALYPQAKSFYRQLNLNILTEQAARINPNDHTLHLTGGRVVAYDRLLLSTGATASRPELAGADLKGVVKLDTMDDAKEILTLSRRAKSAVVVGGGITALELVEGLAALGVSTHYFLRGDRYWTSVLDETESKIVEDRLKEDGVIIHYNTRVSEILGKDKQLIGVKTADGKITECQILAFAIGVRPRKELAQISGLAVGRGVLVNDRLQTSNPDVFAAGDVAQVIDNDHPDGLLESLWSPAILQGQVAGLNMVGQTSPLCRPTAVNVTRLAGLVTTIIGQVGESEEKVKSDRDLNSIMRGDSEEWREVPNAIVAETLGGFNRMRLYVGERSIVGALVMGDQTLSRPLQNLIDRQIDIRPYHARLIQHNEPLPALIDEMWRGVTVRRNQIAFDNYAAKIA
jgi:nitrite reductase (NADH) large subunit